MVYIPSSRYEDAYRRITDGASASQGTALLIFVSTDVDGLCALRILTTLLKRDAIAHKIVPVTNYADISAMNQTLIANSSSQIRSVVFLNCGAQTDIQDLLSLRDGLSVMIVDSHRPFNLYNVFWHEQVQCLDDGDVESNMDALRQAFEAIEFGESPSNDEDNSSDENGDAAESEEEDDDDDEGSAALETAIGRKRGSSEMLGDLAQRNSSVRRRRKQRRRVDMDPEEFLRIQERRAQRREERAEHRQMIQAYYAQGSYYGQSCAISALALAEQLGQPPTLDTVWWAIVGASSQHILQHIDADGYAVVVRRMRDLVRRVSPISAAGTSSSSSYRPGGSLGGMVTSGAGAAHSTLDSGAFDASSSSQALLDSQLGGLPGADESSASHANVDLFNPYLDLVDEEDDEGYLRARAGASTNAEAGLLISSKTIMQQMEISESAELKFTLLRHWSLDSSMRFSPYVATRLATWSSRGRARLDLLLAKLGLSKAEAQAPYLHLAPDLKKQLYHKMAEIGSDYDMPDALYPGFVRNYGWRKSRFSASDMALALLALLQKDTWVADNIDTQSQQQQSGFFAAYDALSQYGVLKQGIDGAQLLQRMVVSQGISMLERQAVKTLRRLRFAILGELEVTASTTTGHSANNSTSNHGIFSSPFALRQLALFLMQTLRERSTKSDHARRPFIIAAPTPTNDSLESEKYLVLGITPLDCSLIRPHLPEMSFNQSTYAGESRNHFGLVFEEVAAQVGAEAKQGFFDSSVMEIRRSDMSTFVDRLRRHL
ncbi:CDC45-like protein [Coemansia reversa NRRL 1564]|uniref:CDC45-like protein n=1 Tax=Coemansia reversa (strain ATCC 12441 / NRRL 1564) TaxID=763665 RepID=A0A2G5B728_COERN|nr:CDC45-like protein [Coemansia reversa NRRL 1564]|eukprot:PIA14818.1 CDC45-like protein [Coemansia reversa NRRL 1564]